MSRLRSQLLLHFGVMKHMNRSDYGPKVLKQIYIHIAPRESDFYARVTPPSFFCDDFHDSRGLSITLEDFV